jgi:CTP synthase
MGIQPDFVVGRAELPIDDKRKEKVAFYCNLDKEEVISNPDMDSIYALPLLFHEQQFDKKVLAKLNLETRKPRLVEWKQLVDHIRAPKQKSVTIAIIAKYIATGDYELTDSYASLIESLHHASWHHKYELNIKFVNAEELEGGKKAVEGALRDVDGIIVPIGWGSRGVEGKIAAIQYSRENKVPYLGLCYGMQLACVEFARNVLGLSDANTTEVNPETTNPIIHSIPFDPKYQRIKGEGASMRLGAYDCLLKPGSLIDSIYAKHNTYKDKKTHLISERHRHRFEFNNVYREALEAKGLKITGTSPDDFFVEMIELDKKLHPFFVATQAHPEYKSRPLAPHPMFVEYLAAAAKQ